MNSMEEMKKQMPYRESEEYVSRLVSDAAERAISQHAATKRRSAKVVALRTRLAAAAAVAVLLAGIGITYYNKVQPATPLTAQQQESPVDQFLDGLTDEEALQLAYYEIEDIPEY